MTLDGKLIGGGPSCFRLVSVDFEVNSRCLCVGCLTVDLQADGGVCES